jgi:hypothetical protein
MEEWKSAEVTRWKISGNRGRWFLTWPLIKLSAKMSHAVDKAGPHGAAAGFTWPRHAAAGFCMAKTCSGRLLHGQDMTLRLSGSVVSSVHATF